MPGCPKPGLPIPVLGSTCCVDHMGLIGTIVDNFLKSSAQPVQPTQVAQPVQVEQPVQIVESAIAKESIFDPDEFPTLPKRKIDQSEPIESKVVQPNPIPQPEPAKMVGCQSRIAGTRCYGDRHDLNNQWGYTVCRSCHVVERFLKYYGKNAEEFRECQGPKGKRIARSGNCAGANHHSYAKRCFACDKEGESDVFRDMLKEITDNAARH